MDKRILCVIAFIILFGQIQGQDFIHGNAGDIYDSKSCFVNPALIPFQGTQFFCGMKFYHLGLLKNDKMGFRNTYLGYINPYLKGFGVGLSGQFFHSPIYQESHLNFKISKRLMHVFSIGINLQAFMLGYNRDNFHLVDENDPVFLNGTNKTNLGIGCGFAYVPFRKLVVGVGAQYLNQPNISLIGDDIRKRPEVFFGIVYTYNFYRAFLDFTLDKDQRLVTKGHIEAFSEQFGFLRVGFRGSLLNFETKINLWGSIGLNYHYDYPILEAQGISGGSHLIGLIFDFDRVPSLPKLRMNPVPHKLLLKSGIKSYNPEPRYEILTSVQKLEIIEKQIERFIDPAISPKVLSRLSMFDIVQLDSSFNIVKAIPFNRQVIRTIPEKLSLRGSFSHDYLDGIKLLNRVVKYESNIPVHIVTDLSDLQRAKQIQSQIVFEDNKGKTVAVSTPQFESEEEKRFFNMPANLVRIQKQESLIVLSVDTVVFDIIPVFVQSSPRIWRLVIEDENGNKFKIFSGSTNVPEQIIWDWRDDTGRLLSHGIYRICFEWMDQNRKVHKSFSEGLFVKKYLRKIDLNISRKKPELKEKPEEINLLVR